MTRTSTYNTHIISLHQHQSLSRRTLIRSYTYAAARWTSFEVPAGPRA